jgi:spore coat polysaccharide biosynthesis predicted glycosyltransferase SpsG
MVKADIAISGGGSTCWELACLGLPNIIIYVAPDNQQAIVEKLDKEGIAINLGWFRKVNETDITTTVEKLINNPDKRQKMSRNGKRLVDGKGVTKVVKIVLDRLKYCS